MHTLKDLMSAGCDINITYGKFSDLLVSIELAEAILNAAGEHWVLNLMLIKIKL